MRISRYWSWNIKLGFIAIGLRKRNTSFYISCLLYRSFLYQFLYRLSHFVLHRITLLFFHRRQPNKYIMAWGNFMKPCLENALINKWYLSEMSFYFLIDKVLAGSRNICWFNQQAVRIWGALVYFENYCFNKRAPLTWSMGFPSQKKKTSAYRKEAAALMVADKRITKVAYC